MNSFIILTAYQYRIQLRWYVSIHILNDKRVFFLISWGWRTIFTRGIFAATGLEKFFCPWGRSDKREAENLIIPKAMTCTGVWPLFPPRKLFSYRAETYYLEFHQRHISYRTLQPEMNSNECVLCVKICHLFHIRYRKYRFEIDFYVFN